MNDWMTKGCEHCRLLALRGGGDLPKIGTSFELHAFLRRCPKCRSLWIENEREMHVIDEPEARREFPDFTS